MDAERFCAKGSAIVVNAPDSRTGVALNKEEFYRMDEGVSSVSKGQHLNYIIASNERCQLRNQSADAP